MSELTVQIENVMLDAGMAAGPEFEEELRRALMAALAGWSAPEGGQTGIAEAPRISLPAGAGVREVAEAVAASVVRALDGAASYRPGK